MMFKLHDIVHNFDMLWAHTLERRGRTIQDKFVDKSYILHTFQMNTGSPLHDVCGTKVCIPLILSCID